MSLIYHRSFSNGLEGKYAKVIERLPPKSRILEIGCHTGYFSSCLLNRGYLSSVEGMLPLESLFLKSAPLKKTVNWLRRLAITAVPELFTIVYLLEATPA